MALSSEVSVAKVVRGALYLYIGTLVVNIVGYLYWIIVSKFVSPSDIGVASLVTNISAITMGVVSLGIPMGIRRFLGKAYMEKNMEEFRRFASMGLIILLLTSGLAALVFIAFREYLAELANVEPVFVIMLSMLVILTTCNTLFNSLFVSTVRTKVVMILSILNSVNRLIIGTFLVYIGYRAFGIVLGILIPVSITFLLYLALSIYSGYLDGIFFEIDAVKEVLKAGSANWIPQVIFLFGVNFGVILVYGMRGAFEGGLYYIALAIARVIFAINASLSSLLFPILSGMKDRRKRVAWRVTRFALAVVTPISVVVALYGDVILSMFRPEYVQAHTALAILVIGAAPAAIISMINVLIYAYGMYKRVLKIGLSSNVPRLLMYFILTPIMGSTGAALSFLIGVFTGLTVAVFFAYKVGFKISWRDVAVLIPTPFLLAVPVYMFNVPWFIGTPLIVAVSLFIYARLKALLLEDVKEIAKAILPRKVIEFGLEKFGWLIDFVFK